jgi:hypothetical protein
VHVKRICGPRTIAICWQFPDTEVRIMDPSLDESMDAKLYADSLFDPQHVKVAESASPPSWLEVRAMPRPLLLVAEQPSPRARADWWARCCIRKADGYVTEDDAGITAPVALEFEKWGDKLDILTEASLESLGLGEMESYALLGMLRTIAEAGRGPLVRRSSRPSGPAT